MNTNSKKKLRVIIAVTSILTLLFIVVVGREYDVNANDNTRLVYSLYDNEINIVYAAAYLRYMLDEWGPLAL